MTKFCKYVLTGAILAMCGSGLPSAAQSQTSIEVALFGEPPGLDPVIVSNDAAATVTQHFLETLYTFNSKWEIAPLLASAMPDYAENGTIVTIPIRTDAMFHNGNRLTVDDVVASLKRWVKVASRGQVVGDKLISIEANGPDKVVIHLEEPFAPLLSLLAYNSSSAVIVPAAANDVEGPLTEFIGTGPYVLLERRPDQYTLVGRFDGYVSPKGPADGYAGERKAIIDEIRFVPVPNPATRLAGAISGQFVFADAVPNDSFERLKATEGVSPVPVEPAWTAFMIINNKGGATKNIKVRQAMQAAINPGEMLLAAMGNPNLFDTDGSIYAKGTAFSTQAGTEYFNRNDPELAARLLKEAGYKGEPIRLLTSQQFEVLFNQTIVAKENLERAGFTVEVLVMDWASVTKKRINKDAWEGYVAWHAFTPEPSVLTFISAGYPGWWDTPEKRVLLSEFTREVDLEKRRVVWAKLQELLYKQASTLIHGHFSNVTAVSDSLVGYVPMPWPAFWNVSIAK